MTDPHGTTAERRAPSSGLHRGGHPWGWIAGGIALALLQLSLALAVDTRALDRLCQWDCGWYRGIVVDGYRTEIPPRAQSGTSNVAFLPGYPLAAWTVSRLPGLTAERALVWTAVLFAMATWAYWIPIARWLLGEGASLPVATMLIATYPGSFYLVAGYSESLFLAAMLGFIYWCERALQQAPGPSLAWFLALAHGIALTGTRLLGIALLVYPILRVLALDAPRPLITRRLLWSGVLAGLSTLGMLAFLAYCQVKFGRWDIYFETVRTGWYARYGMTVPAGLSELFDAGFSAKRPVELGRGLTWITMALTVWGLWIGVRRRELRTVLLPLLGTALCYLALTVAGRVSIGFESMLRYLLPVWPLLLLAFGYVYESWRARQTAPVSTAVQWAVLAAIALQAVLQTALLVRFINGHWVA